MSTGSDVNDLVVAAPAKINLYLGVGPKRPDGYHELATVFQALNLYDTLRFGPGGGLTLTVEPEGVVSAGPDNLILRAAHLLQEEYGVEQGARIEVTKAIPIAGGMAGGSSDAAAALVGCNLLWGLGLSAAELAPLAARLGSDVPFCLLGGTALGSSRGEHLSPVLTSGSFDWVIATSPEGLSTPEVYAMCDELRGGADVPAPQVPNGILRALRNGSPEELGACLYNDLQPAAVTLRPELDLLLETGLDYGALGALVSGSGPTCAFLARDAEHALDLTVGLSGTGLCRGALVARSPGPGVRQIRPPVGEGGDRVQGR